MTAQSLVVVSERNAIVLVSESFAAPRQLDSLSCDFIQPLRLRTDLSRVPDTSAVRNCYRSRRVDVSGIAHTNKAFVVFLHGAESDLVYGAVRVTLFRKRADCPELGDIGVTGSIGDDVYIEAAVVTRSVTQGTGVGTYMVSGSFDSVVVTIMQPCAGFSLHVIEPVLGDGATIPTVGIRNA
jgi:hypothetical protein